MPRFSSTPLLLLLLICFTIVSCDTLRKAPSNASAAPPYSRNTNTVSRNTKGSVAKRPSKSSPTRASTPPATTEIAQVIKTARNYTGTPYRAGGNDRRGIDCSGLICTVYSEIGVKVPRISWQQSEYGREVSSVSDIRPGDWLFFVPEAGKEGYVSHAGIVTDVRGSEEIIFIHASSSRGVREDNLFSTYFKGRFVKAMRPF
ncbi:cell wall-associated NlpC family hydrolase [Dyadobacter jejuensis]|uniref:Cell wall-associated NlpC family hydrolase n=1 Tax=Dyadobacter jejuensis TaxID=1082580 RepID=A0A316AB83_9BACT|nr:C40 family peptidase [Dyadobacter jejuensis]PWJ54498.1 cell wall-associated NlpC family hydrolase [Dyadobacter jejuensis]